MKTHNIRSIHLLLACGWMAAALAVTACSHWPGTHSRSSHRNPARHVSQRDMNQFADSIRYQPADAADHYRLGRFFQQRGRHVLAVAEFSRAIDSDPRRADAYNALGVSYDQLRLFDLAEQFYHRALMLNPEFAAAYNNLGYSYLMQGRPEKAIAPLQKAISLQDRNTRFHNNLALAYRETGRSGLGSPPPASVDPADEMTGIEKAGGDKNAPTSPAASMTPGTAPPAEQPRQAVSDASQPDEYTHATAGNTQTGLLWVNPRIEIANGNGVNRMARNIGNYFKYKGFDVHRLTNADHFDYPRTRIFYSDGQRQAACTLSRMLFGPDSGCDLIYSGRKHGRIRVLMGSDVAGLNDLFSGKLKIRVANGNGVKHIARRLSDYLRTKGFHVVNPVDAEHFGYEFTQIVYPADQLTNARFLAREFPENDAGRLVEADRRTDTICIIIGKDFTL